MAFRWEDEINGSQFENLGDFSEFEGTPREILFERFPWQLPEDITVLGNEEQLARGYDRHIASVEHPLNPTIIDTAIVWEYILNNQQISRTVAERIVGEEIVYGQVDYLINSPESITKIYPNVHISHRFEADNDKFTPGELRTTVGSWLDAQMLSILYDNTGNLSSIGFMQHPREILAKKKGYFEKKYEEELQSDFEFDKENVVDKITDENNEFNEKGVTEFTHLFFTIDGIRVKNYADTAMRFMASVPIDAQLDDQGGYYSFDEGSSIDEDAIDDDEDVATLPRVEPNSVYQQGDGELAVIDGEFVTISTRKNGEVQFVARIPKQIDIDSFGQSLSTVKNVPYISITPYLPVQYTVPDYLELNLAA